MLKRLFDIVFSIIGLIVLFPLFIIIAILIKFDSRGPVLFFQKRVGKSAKLFTLIKFRSMYINHDNTSTVSIDGENRVTLVGKWLRKSKLDELPELWNVLNGDMSFVGPRPDVPGYADKLKGDARDILKIRPGITGPASIKYFDEEIILSTKDNPQNYNDKVIYPDKVRLNLEYYHNNNIFKDIKIIFATIFRIRY